MKPTDPPPPQRPGGRLPHGAPPEPDPRDAHARFDDGVPHHTSGDHDELDNEDVAHEHSDINVRAVLMSAAIIAAVVIASHVIVYFLFGWFERAAIDRDPEVSPLAAPAVEMPRTTVGSPFLTESVPDVQLLTNEPMALERQRAAERQRLQGYGWVDQGTGVAHIPIDEAKRLLLERGLPSREFDPVDPSLGTRRPAAGEATGGRMITGVLPDAGAAPEGPEEVEPSGDQPDDGEPPGAPPPGSENH